MKIGNSIRAEREKRKMLQKDLAEKSGLTQAHLSQIENNAREPSRQTLKEISRALGVSVPALIFLSLEDADIKPGMQEAFKQIAPLIQGMIIEA